MSPSVIAPQESMNMMPPSAIGSVGITESESFPKRNCCQLMVSLNPSRSHYIDANRLANRSPSCYSKWERRGEHSYLHQVELTMCERLLPRRRIRPS